MSKNKSNLVYEITVMAVLGMIGFWGCDASPEGNATHEIQFRKISVEDYEDKVAGGWIGQAAGVLFGQDTEFKWMRQIVPFDLDDFYRSDPAIQREVWQSIDTVAARASGDWSEYVNELQRRLEEESAWEKYTPEEMSNQDDLYIEFLFLHSIRDKGLDVTARELAEDWVSYIAPDRIWGANKAAYNNFIKGIWPPMSGHPDNTEFGNAIDFQIESDLFGLISPGLPQSSNAWGYKAGHLMNHGDGVYAGMALGAMYGEAFFESDPRKLVNYSLKVIPPESGYARMVNDVIAAYDNKPDDWQAAWHEIEAKWGTDRKLDVRINGAYIYIGLLYGEGDFLKTMNIAMRCGMDSDCNPSNVAGVIGTIMGLKSIPEKWTILRVLPISNVTGENLDIPTIREIYPHYLNWDDVIASTVEVGKQNILANGGKIEDGMIYIPVQKPTIPALEQVPTPTKKPND